MVHARFHLNYFTHGHIFLSEYTQRHKLVSVFSIMCEYLSDTLPQGQYAATEVGISSWNNQASPEQIQICCYL